MEPTTPQKNTTARSTTIAVLVALVLIAGVAIKYYPPAQAVALRAWAPVSPYWSALTLPKELRAAQFTAGNTAYKASRIRYVVQKSAVPAEVSAAYALPFNAATTKANPAVSPSRTEVVFQQLSDSGNASSTTAWQVSVANTVTTSQQPIGKGAHPYFIDDNHVAIFTEKGLVVHDLTKTGTSTDMILLAQPFVHADMQVSVSPNHNVVAFREVKDGPVSVFSVSPTNATVVTAYGGKVTSFGVADTALYLLENNPKGSEVLRYAFMPHPVPVHVATLPASLGISGLSFSK